MLALTVSLLMVMKDALAPQPKEEVTTLATLKPRGSEPELQTKLRAGPPQPAEVETWYSPEVGLMAEARENTTEKRKKRQKYWAILVVFCFKKKFSKAVFYILRYLLVFFACQIIYFEIIFGRFLY